MIYFRLTNLLGKQRSSWERDSRDESLGTSMCRGLFLTKQVGMTGTERNNLLR